jgi:hypothetical protein
VGLIVLLPPMDRYDCNAGDAWSTLE